MTDGPTGNRGKWGTKGVPHKGWNCIQIEDLGTPSMTCQMCESSEIRYTHYMQHPLYPSVLICGAVCAGHMEEDLVSAKKRDKAMKDTARRKSSFPKLKGWKVNSNGNHVLVKDGARITIFKKGSNWQAVASNLSTPTHRGHYINERLSTPEEAKLAVFSIFETIKNDA